MMEFLVRRFLYYPTSLPKDAPLPPHCADAQEIWFPTTHGDNIHSLYWPAAPKDPTILFFHGNAQTTFEWAFVREEMESISAGLLLIDYPGYGKSTGKPSEESLYAAGYSAWKWLIGQGIEPKDIIVFGKSLGGGVATEISHNKKPGGLILESTFRSIPSVARVLLPMIPSDALFNTERYDSLSKMEKIHCPVLVIHGSNDGLIPIDEGRALHAAANPPKEIFVVPGAGHNNVSMVAMKDYGKTISRWLTSIRE